jgi:lysozyme family protein
MPTSKPDAFQAALRSVLESEGGWVNDPTDPGGATNAGVTQPTLDQALAAGIVEQGTTLQTLTAETVDRIYRSLYWLPIRGDELPRAVAFALFDTAVHSGVPQAIRLFQESQGIRVDGIFGPETLQAARRLPNGALDAFWARRAAFLADLVAARPGLTKFRAGWLRRCFRCARQSQTENSLT